MIINLSLELYSLLPLLFYRNLELFRLPAFLMKELKSFDPIIDDDASKRPGWKFAQYELIGIPLRIEIGTIFAGSKNSFAVSSFKGTLSQVLVAQNVNLVR